MSADEEQMQCPKCKEPFAPGKKFCSDCGAPLDLVSATIRALIDDQVDRTFQIKFKDQRFVDLDTSAAIASRLTGWAKQFMYWAGIPLVIVAIALVIFGVGTYRDFTSKVAAANEKVADAASKAVGGIEPKVASARHELSELQQKATGINGEYQELQSDIGRYKQVNQSIEALQKQFRAVQGQIIDLGKHELRVGTLMADSISTAGPGPSLLAFARLGCPPSPPAGAPVAYCTQGAPPSLFQVTFRGETKPVSGRSQVGFQDVSVTAKPTCSEVNRGTLYVEKGTTNVADKPFLCAKRSNNEYAWIQLVPVP